MSASAATPAAPDAPSTESPDAANADLRFSPEEEADLLSESAAQKTQGNAFFSSAAYSDAISAYSRALAKCPNYLDYDVAVLRANVAACHLKLSEWKEAVEAATAALECLDRVDPPVGAAKDKEKDEDKAAKRDGDATSAVDERVEEVDDDTAERIEALARSGRSREDVQKLRIKALLRRAKARSEVGGWASLQGAEEDYRALAAMPNLAPLDKKAVEAALRVLPRRLDEAKQKEMGEMMGKLKDLGNGILRPFGLSTDSFQFVKDEKSGNYSIQMNQ
ncbi:hypothetical protein IWX90DRAFT_217208 [Phyllosticta citrichinensis]|uniref:Tetratricopeptide repeat protein 1 n=1 Tax=Phyllosticta citrichinensis TaxID=1130410 RepID=A0ABR1XTH5_9PEZI